MKYLLILLLTSCACEPVTKYIHTKIPIPAHQELPALTQDEYNNMAPEVREKMQKMKAILIGNVYKLEKLIEANNTDIKTK